MRTGLDYAWGHISPAGHRSVGSTFACRYLSLDSSKNLSRSELADLRSGNIDVVVVWETSASRALAGMATGVSDARTALGQARGLGIPSDRPIYFAVDFDESAGQASAVASYFKGVASVLGVARTGVYGGYWSVKRLLDAHLVRYAWQTYAWSGGKLDGRAQLYQYSNGHTVAGQGCDFNHALHTDFGQWGFRAGPDPYAIFDNTLLSFSRHWLANQTVLGKKHPELLKTFSGSQLRLRERSTMRERDRLSKTAPHSASFHKHQLWILVLRCRLAWVAQHSSGGWNKYHRRRRWQEMWERTQHVR